MQDAHPTPLHVQSLNLRAPRIGQQCLLKKTDYNRGTIIAAQCPTKWPVKRPENNSHHPPADLHVSSIPSPTVLLIESLNLRLVAVEEVRFFTDFLPIFHQISQILK